MAAAVLMVAGAQFAVPGPSQGEGAGPTRILVLGDSVTQGSVGDWTWRYRLWQHLRATGADVDFVGPSSGLYDPVTEQLGDPRYAEPAFDSDHAARWGQALWAQDYAIGDLVRTFRPDVVVEMLGTNDVLFSARTVEQAQTDLERLVTDAQAADPDVDLVLGSLPQVWEPAIAQLDAALPGLAAQTATAGSRVVVATPAEGLVRETDTYDTLHPSATGEVKIAAGVADALASLGVGAAYPRPLPAVANGPTAAPALAARAGDARARLVWTAPPGTTGVFVWVRDATEDEDWVRLPYALAGSSWAATELENFHDWQFRLQATKGTAVAEGLYSNTVTVRPAPDEVRAVTVTPGVRSLELLWPVVRGATSYLVTWTGPGTSGARVVSTPSVAITGLVAGQAYEVSVTPSWDENAGSAQVVTAVAGGVAPERVTGLLASADRRARARLVWEPADATSYQVQHRVAGVWTDLGRGERTAYRTGALPRGPHAFRVRAWFDLLPGPWSTVARVRVPRS